MNTKTGVISQAQLQEQFAFCDKIAAHWQQQSITPTAYVETYGCQQNEADSEKLRGYLSQSGYTIGTEAEGADVVIMNDQPSKLADAVQIARKTRTIVTQNIVFVLAIKFLVLLLGALGHATMWMAVFADVGVAIIAVMNSLRILRHQS